MTFIHICGSPRYNNIEEFKKFKWEDAAVYYYQRLYCFPYEHSENEWIWLREAEIILKDTIPGNYKEGVYLLRAQAADMGEDIYVVDSVITHTSHVKHDHCKTYKILDRGKELWCTTCSKVIDYSEIIREV